MAWMVLTGGLSSASDELQWLHFGRVITELTLSWRASHQTHGWCLHGRPGSPHQVMLSPRN